MMNLLLEIEPLEYEKLTTQIITNLYIILVDTRALIAHYFYMLVLLFLGLFNLSIT